MAQNQFQIIHHNYICELQRANSDVRISEYWLTKKNTAFEIMFSKQTEHCRCDNFFRLHSRPFHSPTQINFSETLIRWGIFLKVTIFLVLHLEDSIGIELSKTKRKNSLVFLVVLAVREKILKLFNTKSSTSGSESTGVLIIVLHKKYSTDRENKIFGKCLKNLQNTSISTVGNLKQFTEAD